MGATTLLHEVYLTVHARDGVVFPDHARFLAYASRAMRGLIIDYARSEGLRRIEGQVLRENTVMLDMCKHLGFDVKSDPADSSLVLVTFSLE